MAPSARPTAARFAQSLDIRAVEEEAHWAAKEASASSLREYLSDLRDLLNSIGTLSPEDLAALDSERTTDADAQLEELRDRVGRNYELLGEAYSRKAGKFSHTYDCPVSASPAFRPQACNCNAPGGQSPHPYES